MARLIFKSGLKFEEIPHKIELKTLEFIDLPVVLESDDAAWMLCIGQKLARLACTIVHAHMFKEIVENKMVMV